MNPLKQNQIETLKKLKCDDLARKIDEIVNHINGSGDYRFRDRYQEGFDDGLKRAVDTIEELTRL